jgi:phage recombination protein Bet
MAKVATAEEPRIIVAEDGRTYTFDEVATYVKYHAPTAKQEEIEEFFNYCKLRGLSPYDVHFIKYGNNKPVIVVGKDAFLKRAERSKQLDGYKAGVIAADKETGEIKYREGAFYIKSKEELVGGWAEVYRKDYSHPIRVEVALEEYLRTTKDGKPMNNWAQMPATMIRKVALVQALREAFPSEMSGMYVPEEMGVEINEETGEVISHGGLDSSSNDIGSSSGSPDSRVNSKPVTEAQIKAIKAIAKDIWGDTAERQGKALLQLMFKKESTKELTREEASTFIKELKSIQEEKAKKKADEEFFLSQP